MVGRQRGRSSVRRCSKARGHDGWVSNAPDSMSRIPHPAALVLAAVAGWPGPCCFQVDSGKAQTNPNPAVRVPAGRAGCSSARARSRRSSSRPTAGPCGQPPPGLAILKTTERCLKAAADIERCVAAAREQAQGAAEVMQTTAQGENRALRPTAWDSMPRGAAGGQGPRRQRTPRHSLSGPSLEPLLKSGRSSRGGDAGEHLCPPGRPPGWRRHRWRCGLISPPTPTSRRPPRSHHRR